MSEEIIKQVEELNKQVLDLRNQGKYQEGIPIAEKSCELSKEEYGEEHPDYAKSLNLLGSLSYFMGDYPTTERIWIQAKEIRRKTLGEEHPDFAASLNNLGAFYQDIGNYASAESLHLQAKEIRRKTLGEEHPVYAQSLNNLGNVYKDLGNFSAAESLHLQSKEIKLKTLGEEHPVYAISLCSLANLYYVIGAYSSSESLHLQVKKIRQKALGEEHPDYASSLNNLAIIYHDIGNYSLSESLYLQAKEIRRKMLGEEHPKYADSLHNLAVLYYDLGNYSLAESLYLQAKEIRKIIFGEEHQEYADSLQKLAVLYLNFGNYSSAESLYLQAKEIIRKTFGEEHPDYAGSLYDLAELYRTIENYTSAEPLQLQSIEIRRKALGEEHTYFAESLNGIGKLYAATNRTNEALECLNLETEIHDRLLAQIFSFASDHQRMDYLKKIQPSFDTSISLIYQHFSSSPEEIQLTLDLILRRKAIAAEALATQRDTVLGGKYPELKEKLKELTTHRMQIALKELKGPGPEGKEYHDKLIAEWTEKKEKLESELVRQIPEMNLEERLRAADRKAVAKALPKDSVLVEFVKFNEYNFKAIPANGDKQWKPARYLAFVMPSGKPDEVTMIDLGEAEKIDKLIMEFRSSILGDLESPTRSGTQTEKESTVSKGKGVDLHKAVFKPLVKSIKGFKHVFISPDGDLSRLPFEVLPSGKNKYLVDKYNISYLSVGRDVLRFSADSHGNPESSLVAADPDFDMGSLEKPEVPESEYTLTRGWRTSRDFDRSTLNFERLPGTRPESDKVSSILKINPWIEDKVLEGKLKSVHSPFILHLATHGFFLEDQKTDPGMEKGPRYENPLLRSGLALAGANTSIKGGTLPDDAEDGILTAEDVSGLDLTETELVVLSACETGLGEIRTGEGVFGLRRAFMLAGTKTLVMSLWKVADLTTPIIMGRFYDNLLNKKLPRDESLREAQLYLRGLTIKEIREKHLTTDMIAKLSSGNEKVEQELDQFLKLPDDTTPFSDPIYWGAFICQGEISPMESTKGDGKKK
jgi:CHAT domain-containing protein/tetratricopeptide (TPR) repeat protein